MITVKMLKPYYIKANPKIVRVVLAYQYFSVVIKNEVYQFIPSDEKEIRINRYNKKIENIEARFAFQKGKEIVYMSMTDLISLPDFIFQLHTIVEPYFIKKVEPTNDETKKLFEALELQNLKRLVDQALDERDYETLEKLAPYFLEHNKV